MRLSILPAKSLSILLVSACISLYILVHLRQIGGTRGFDLVPSIFSNSNKPSAQSVQAVELVVSSLKEENTSWYSVYFPYWKSNIYVVDDPTAPLTVPQNKGHEAMVYLTYIIDRYDNLPASTLFLHAERFQWHNDNPDYDGVLMLRNFQLSYLQTQGYVNLRCVWTLGCPAAYHPLKDDASSQQENSDGTGAIYLETFRELLPEYRPPTQVGVSCCAQFAVTRDTIRRRPREDYVRFRKWLLDTPLRDELSGRFFEHSWHIIFGKDPVFCPSADDCYCKVYGMCNLPNCTQRGCEGQYEFPPYSTLPEQWPRIGWDGEERSFSSPL